MSMVSPDPTDQSLSPFWRTCVWIASAAASWTLFGAAAAAVVAVI